MYNDFPLISESEILKLSKAYNERLNIAKSLNVEDNFLERFNRIEIYLKNALHYIDNLINWSKNLEDKNLLKDIRVTISNSLENLKTLYEINETERINENEIKNESNYYSNLKNIIFYLLNFLEEMFYLIQYENNNKIKVALNKVFLESIEQIKKVNSLLKTINTFKVFSLFKKY